MLLQIQAMAAHSALYQQVHVVNAAPPVPETAVAQDGIRREMGAIEERLGELNSEKLYMDQCAHDHRLRRLHSSHHAMQLPYLAGSDSHALYAGGVAALPPRSWLDASPMTRELLMTKVPAVQLAEPNLLELQTELEQLKKLNPAETIATLQRLNITSSEKLRLYRHLDLEQIDGVHPGGMLAHAKAGLPIHPREAEAQLVEQIRDSHAPDIDKVWGGVRPDIDKVWGVGLRLRLGRQPAMPQVYTRLGMFRTPWFDISLVVLHLTVPLLLGVTDPGHATKPQ